jgi:hypothetical protein
MQEKHERMRRTRRKKKKKKKRRRRRQRRSGGWPSPTNFLVPVHVSWIGEIDLFYTNKIIDSFK